MQANSYQLLCHVKNDSIYNESGMHMSKISNPKSVALIIWLHHAHAGVKPMTSCSSNGNCLGIFPGFLQPPHRTPQVYYPFNPFITRRDFEPCTHYVATDFIYDPETLRKLS